MAEDQITPRSLGSKDYWSNRQLLHRHCHDEKTAIDLIKIREKKHSDILNKLSHFWEEVEWEWIEDIPVYKG
ncbi:HNH endonuclease [Microseira wollei]|nr:HNH endonuclease signature motif containing protein [Microseira wollei]